MEALYVSSNLETALSEYGQSIKDRPGTFCRYDINETNILDLRDSAQQAAVGTSQADLDCDWLKIATIDKKDPPTWILVDKLVTLGYRGALVSTMIGRRGGYNLVLWKWSDKTVKPYDPNDDLPD